MVKLERMDPEAMTDNVFRLIGTDWMLITAGVMNHFNTMTASWGGLGVLWHQPVATVYVRPTRYTDEFMRRYEGFTLSFFGEGYREALNVCGTLSGRDVDKVNMAGLTPLEIETGRIAFSEARLVISCRKVYADQLKPDRFLDRTLETHYPKKDYHHLYIGIIDSVFCRDS